MKWIAGSAPSTDELRKAYDALPYPSPPTPFTHVSRVAAIGWLRGVNAAAPADCRVLELGCADGGNLLPMAAQLPASRFVGIDLSAVQIALGRETVAALALSNIELRAADIMELRAADLGKFDYILVHGVYSWVPAAVQQKILAICRDCLAENGIAYVSYNTYPGWRGKEALLEMLQYHTRDTDDLRGKVAAAMDLIGALHDPALPPDSPGASLAQRLQLDLKNMADPAAYLIHEYLVDSNQPVYFGEFLDRIASFSLQYVDDAFPGSTALERLQPAAQDWIRRHFADYAAQQQYVDFIGNVAFRRSLLCHRGLSLQREVAFDRLRRLHATATCRREESGEGPARFRTEPGRQFSVEHAGLRRALERLTDARPESVPVADLAEALGDEVSAEEAAAVFEGLLRSAAVEFTWLPTPCTREPGERPRASPLVRRQAASGLVTCAAHRPVRLDDVFARQLLPLLDGTRTVPELTLLLRGRLTPEKPLGAAEWDALVRGQLASLGERGLLERTA